MDKNEQLRRRCVFLRDYACAIYSAGATTIRIEKNLERIAETWNERADFSILPGNIILTLWDPEEKESFNIVGKVPAEKINFAFIKELSSLSWQIKDESLDTEEADSRLRKVLSEKRISPALVLFLVGVANASFCELFGGDLISMAIVFVATIQGFFLKQRLPETGMDFRIATLIAACVSAIISCSGFVFGWGNTPDTALATSVLYLVPGIPFANSVSDLIYGHYVCAMSRFCHAMVITTCLSLGLCLAFLILNLKFV